MYPHRAAWPTALTPLAEGAHCDPEQGATVLGPFTASALERLGLSTATALLLGCGWFITQAQTPAHTGLRQITASDARVCNTPVCLRTARTRPVPPPAQPLPLRSVTGPTAHPLALHSRTAGVAAARRAIRPATSSSDNDANVPLAGPGHQFLRRPPLRGLLIAGLTALAFLLRRVLRQRGPFVALSVCEGAGPAEASELRQVSRTFRDHWWTRTRYVLEPYKRVREFLGAKWTDVRYKCTLHLPPPGLPPAARSLAGDGATQRRAMQDLAAQLLPVLPTVPRTSMTQVYRPPQMSVIRSEHAPCDMLREARGSGYVGLDAECIGSRPPLVVQVATRCRVYVFVAADHRGVRDGRVAELLADPGVVKAVLGAEDCEALAPLATVCGHVWVQ